MELKQGAHDGVLAVPAQQHNRRVRGHLRRLPCGVESVQVDEVLVVGQQQVAELLRCPADLQVDRRSQHLERVAVPEPQLDHLREAPAAVELLQDLAG